ncbi:MAG: hypothetical protein WCV90_09005 [Candidatus Woesearchaeota archaeon]|jgi:hypothetical protein
MEDSLKRNILKIGVFAGLSWLTYKLIKGVSENKSVPVIVKETIAPVVTVVNEVKTAARKLVKGSPEAKKFMADMRAKKKPKTNNSGKAMTDDEHKQIKSFTVKP